MVMEKNMETIGIIWSWKRTWKLLGLYGNGKENENKRDHMVMEKNMETIGIIW